jgi:hypothetical protein
MKRRAINLLTAVSLLLALTVATAQKKDKPWTEWTKQDAEKMLADSPWSQTQVETNTSEMFYSPTTDPRLGAGTNSTTDSRLGQGATNQAVDLKYRVRFFSARPVRQALARLMELQQKLDPAQTERLKAFAEMKSANSIIITVSFESTDQRTLGQAMQAFNSAATGTLKNAAYLERSDGKRLFLEEYVPPGRDGFGARFIFLRTLDESPFITAAANEVRFAVEFPGSSIKVNKRFKVAEMMYDGGLEY